jgi:hypothetical protein
MKCSVFSTLTDANRSVACACDQSVLKVKSGD